MVHTCGGTVGGFYFLLCLSCLLIYTICRKLNFHGASPLTRINSDLVLDLSWNLFRNNVTLSKAATSLKVSILICKGRRLLPWQLLELSNKGTSVPSAFLFLEHSIRMNHY